MTEAQIEKELSRLSLIFAIDQRQKNPVVQRYIRKLRVLLTKIRDLQKANALRGGRNQ